MRIWVLASPIPILCSARVVDTSLVYTTWEKVRLCLQASLIAVHGSLARAGKVKSQTPKVDKQEKKKTPKGRAKKRILYNRRYDILSATLLIFSFVNVTLLPNGKRKMNQNPEK